jgi:hypothetical protein
LLALLMSFIFLVSFSGAVSSGQIPTSRILKGIERKIQEQEIRVGVINSMKVAPIGIELVGSETTQHFDSKLRFVFETPGTGDDYLTIPSNENFFSVLKSEMRRLPSELLLEGFRVEFHRCGTGAVIIDGANGFRRVLVFDSEMKILSREDLNLDPQINAGG